MTPPTSLAVVAAAVLVASTATITSAFHIPAPGADGFALIGKGTELHAEPTTSGSLVGRRAILGSALTVAGTAFLTPSGPTLFASPPAANALVGGATQAARVSSYPGIEDLEPLYELKLSIDALASGVKNNAQWPFIKKRLDKFFKGAILSEKNFYLGVGFQYINDIKYDDDQAYVTMDKQARFGALDSCVTALERLKNNLGGTDAAAVEEDARAAQDALASWFALIPEADVRAVEKLFKDVRVADADRNGVLSDEELATLPADEREVWKRRVSKFG